MIEAGNTISKVNFNTIYNLVYALSAFLAMTSSIRIDIKKYNYYIYARDKFGAVLLMLLLAIIIGLRAYNVGTDTSNYYLFNWIYEFPPESNSELFFYWIINLVKYLGQSFTVFLLIVSFLFMTMLYLALLNISKRFRANFLWLFFCFFSLFFFKNLSINIIRQGLSLVCLLYALSCWVYDGRISTKVYIICALAYVSHTTAIIPIMLFLFAYFFTNYIPIKYFYILYVLGILLSLANFGILNFAPFIKDYLGNSNRAAYLQGSDSVYVVGFKPQFVAFNTVFLFFFYYMFHKVMKRNTILVRRYEIIYKYYLLASFVFFMTFQIPYSDRWGLFAWMVIPLLMAPYFTFLTSKIQYRTPAVLFFCFIYIFFSFYG